MITTDFDGHHTEEVETQHRCNPRHDGKPAARLRVVLAKMVLWLRPWIGSVAHRWLSVGRPFLLVVTTVCPGDPWGFVELGTAYAQRGDYGRSAEYFAMAAERGSAVGTLCLGDLLMRGNEEGPGHALGQRLVDKALAVLDPSTGALARTGRCPEVMCPVIAKLTHLERDNARSFQATKSM